MDKHVLFINTEENTDYFYSNLSSLVSNLKKDFDKKKSRTINVNSIYIGVGDDSSEETKVRHITTDNYDWSKDDYLTTPTTHNDLYTISKTCTKDNFISLDYIMVADAVHTLADTLGDIGSYLTYVFVCVKDYVPNLSEIPELYGALIRLQEWHRGAIYVITQDSQMVKDWYELLPLSIIQSTEDVTEEILKTFWRGNLVLSADNDETYESPEVVIKCVKGNPVLLSELKADEVVYMSPNAEVVTQVDVGTIPWPYIKHGGIYSLGSGSHTDVGEQTEVGDVIKMMTRSSGTGTILRIRYSGTPPSIEGLQELNTDEWKKNIGEGQFDLSHNVSFKGFHLALTLLVLTEGTELDSALLVVIQDLSGCGDDVLKLVSKESARTSFPKNEENEKKIKGLLGGTLCLTQFHMAALAHLSLYLPDILQKKLKKAGQNIENVWDSIKCEIEGLSCQEILRILTQLQGVDAKFPDNFVNSIPESEADKHFWPEYFALTAPKVNSKMIRSGSADLLGGFAPPLRPESVTTLNALLFLQTFNKDGTPTAKTQSKLVKYVSKGKHYPYKGLQSHKDIFDKKWPEILDVRYHGVHYNRGNHLEKYEEFCNRFRDRYLRKELASTCSTFLEKELFLTTPITKEIANHKSVKLTEKRRSLRNQNDSSGFEGDSASVMSGRSSINFESKLRKSSRLGQDQQKTELRRSPRKRVSLSDTVKPSDLLRPSKGESSKANAQQNKKVPKPAQLTDVHKAKLRIAVVTALEKEGVMMKNKLFSVCFKKLFEVCKPFALDVVGCGSTSKNLEKIAKSHVKQVIEFEVLKARKKQNR